MKGEEGDPGIQLQGPPGPPGRYSLVKCSTHPLKGVYIPLVVVPRPALCIMFDNRTQLPHTSNLPKMDDCL